MLTLISGLIVFLGAHSISIVAPDWRDRTAARLGIGWKIIISIIAVVGIVLVLQGLDKAREAPVLIYVAPHWMRRVTQILMIPVFPLMAATYFPGKIKNTFRHPMLAGVKLWAFAHLLVNGMLHDIVLFGSVFLWAAIERFSLDRRRLSRLLISPGPSPYNDLIAVTAGLTAYFYVLAWLHQFFIGRSPL